MNWLEIALVGAVLVGATAGTVLVVRSPGFWWGLLSAGLSAALPIILKRMTPEEEKAWREAERAGRGDEWLRKRRGAPPKG